jgi:predicted CoA-binding protein
MPLEEDEELRELLELDTIAVVGCSATPGKAAHEVPVYLRRHGYEIIPVNPFRDEIFEREPCESLTDVIEDIDTVEIFRPSDEVADIVDKILNRDDVTVIWTQAGIRDGPAARRAEAAGLRVVQDRCMKVEHGILIR